VRHGDIVSSVITDSYVSGKRPISLRPRSQSAHHLILGGDCQETMCINQMPGKR